MVLPDDNLLEPLKECLQRHKETLEVIEAIRSNISDFIKEEGGQRNIGYKVDLQVLMLGVSDSADVKL